MLLNENTAVLLTKVTYCPDFLIEVQLCTLAGSICVECLHLLFGHEIQVLAPAVQLSCMQFFAQNSLS